jgi:quinol monooxygenase YgiN
LCHRRLPAKIRQRRRAARIGAKSHPNSAQGRTCIGSDSDHHARARDATIIEVSEWKSREAIDAAHKNPNVLAMWEKFSALCDCVPLNTLAEAREMFAGFEPIDD